MKLDIIFVTDNHENVLKDAYDKVKKELKDTKYKIIFVDNCSEDDTLDILNEIYKKDEDHTRIIKLSKKSNYNSCVTAGLNYSKNKYAIVFDLDFDGNINIKKLVSFLEENKKYDSICLCRKIKEDSFINKNYKKLINKFNFYNNIDGISNFRIFNRQMIDAIITHSIDNEITNYTFDNIGFNIYYDDIKTENLYEEKAYLPCYLKPIIISMIIGSVSIFISLIILLISFIIGKFSLVIFTLFLLLLITGGLFILVGIIGRGMLKHIYKKEPNFIIKERIGFDEKVL